jgi:hypothetical protein
MIVGEPNAWTLYCNECDARLGNVTASPGKLHYDLSRLVECDHVSIEQLDGEMFEIVHGSSDLPVVARAISR